MNIYQTYFKFTNYDDSVEYVSLYEYYSQHQDTFQGELSEILYEKIGLTEFVPIKH